MRAMATAPLVLILNAARAQLSSLLLACGLYLILAHSLGSTAQLDGIGNSLFEVEPPSDRHWLSARP